MTIVVAKMLDWYNRRVRGGMRVSEFFPHDSASYTLLIRTSIRRLSRPRESRNGRMSLER